jgi:arylsulfatase
MHMSNQPNFLVFVNEQHRGDSLSCEGHPVLLTPNMDEIAGRGARFSRAYSTCPVCIPARRSFLTGQFPSTHGVVGYAGKEWAGPSIAGELSKAGYQTAWIGRNMHQVPAQDPCDFETTILSDMRLPEDDYDQFMQRNQPEGGGGYYGSGVMHNDWTARPFHLPENLHHTNWTVNQALDFLENRDQSRPFFLVVSFIAAHPPLIPPACYFERYIRTGAPEPVIGDWATPPENVGIGMGVSPQKVHLTGEALLSAKAGYHGLINHLDDQIHRLLNGVNGVDRMTGNNTVVMMTADHGEMLGDHYCWRKQLPYEGAARIPFLIRAPKRFGIKTNAVIDAPVGLEDIMPTVLDMAGADIPDSVDGKSLLPLLRGETDAEWRSYIHLECSPTFHALTDGKEKYAWFVKDGTEQLFDLINDPEERKNLADKSAYTDRLIMWRERLIKELIGRPEGFTDGKSLISGRPYPGIIPA